ncbi:MAG: GatB/YqeY domain-containing protein [Gemmatimonadota bacterium]|nr:GatB/YqeY domain-containing protein [Gemmatimonadota bacterium]
MSEILERIQEDLNSALKAGEKLRVSTLRMLSSELKNRRIDLGRELEDEEAVEVLFRARKQRREAEEQYREAGREELAEREAAEAEIVQAYLPEPLSDEELDRIIDEAIEETGATDPGQMGAVMGRVMPRVKGRAQGAEVSRRVRERLA